MKTPSTFLPPRQLSARRPFQIAVPVLAALILASAAERTSAQTTYYWDSNDSAAGFGTAQGTWAAPTANNSTQGWSTSSAGTTSLSGTTTTTTSDNLNFGTASDQLGTGTINVSGNVSANTIAIRSSSSSLTLSGGNITMAGDLTVTNTANTTAVTHTISSDVTLNGASRVWNVWNNGSTGTANLEYTGALTVANDLTKAGTGTLTLSGTGHSFNTTSRLRFSAGVLALSGDLTTAGQIVVGTSGNNGTFDISGDLTMTRAVNATNFRIGEFANNVGTVNVREGANVSLTGMSVGMAGRGTYNQFGGTVTNNGVVNIGGVNSRINVSGGIFDIVANTLTLGTTAGTNSTLSVSGSGSINMGTLAMGTGSVNATSFVNLGDGTTGGNLTLTGMSYASGTNFINFNGGTLTANNTFSMISQASTVVQSGGAFINVVPTRTFTIGTALTDGGGGGGLTKDGTGTLSLSGANTYSGATTISNGTLVLGSVGSIASSSAINVASGATFNVSDVTGGWALGSGQTLSGSGSVLGDATINGNLLPGNSPGILNFSNNLTLGTTANTTMEILGDTERGTDFDGINVASDLTYDGTLTLAVGTTFGVGTYSFNLFDFSSRTGTFDTITLSGDYTGNLTNSTGDVWSLIDGDNTWTFTHSSGDLGLNVVPEPSTWALLALGVGVVALRIRRRCRRA